MINKITATVFFLPYPILLFLSSMSYSIRCFFMLMLREGKNPFHAYFYAFGGWWAYFTHRLKEEHGQMEEYFSDEYF